MNLFSHKVAKVHNVLRIIQVKKQTFSYGEKNSNFILKTLKAHKALVNHFLKKKSESLENLNSKNVSNCMSC